MVLVDELGELCDELESLVGKLLVDDFDAITGMHEYPIAYLYLGDEVKRHLTRDAHDVDGAHHELLVELLDLGGYCQAHVYSSKRAWATIACPYEIHPSLGGRFRLT